MGANCNDCLRIDAFTLEIRERVTHVVRDAVELARRRCIHDSVVGLKAPGGRGRIPRTDDPVVDVGFDAAGVALLVAGVEAHAPGLVFVGIAEDAVDFGSDLRLERRRFVVHALGADIQHHAVVVQRTRGLDVDGGTNAARRNIGARGLVDLDRADRFRRQVGEVERTALRSDAANVRLSAAESVGTRDLAAVQGDEVELRAEAARRDLCAFAVTAIDRNAGDALQ